MTTAASPEPQPSDRPDAPAAPRCRWLARLPRLETVLLALGLAWTAGAKFVVVRGQQGDLGEWLEATVPDVAFFGSVAALLALLYLVLRWRWAGRLALLVAGAVAVWSLFNAAWLVATKNQLQPGTVAWLYRSPEQIWPMVANHLRHKPLFAALAGVTGVGAGAWFGWRLIRPRPAAAGRAGHLYRAAGWGLLALAMGATGWGLARQGMVAHSGQVIGFSSHWHALGQVVADVAVRDDVGGAVRELPRAGERAVGAPPPDAPRPNVVVIFLESVSHHASSFGAGGPEATPFLTELAAAGTRFVTTRVPVSQTGKAFWAGLTGTLPDLGDDYVESALVDEPYESLATVLARRGYRSAFFEMSKGDFQCAPCAFTNLGFDWGWFRENLEDSSTHLGYMNGDDFAMIDPMFEWVDASDDPFLLVAITSVAHDPFELPAWYDVEPAASRRGRYQQAVTFSDAFVRAVDEQLAARGLGADTILCVIGDHGDSFRPDSKRGRWVPYEEVIRVPWVIRWPGHVEAGREVTAPCSQLDLTPTLLALAGYEVTEAGFDGLDALGPIDASRRLGFSSWYANSPLGYVQGSRKYVYWPYRDTLFAYDLERDPGETAPRTVVGDEKAAVVDELLAWQRAARMEVDAKRLRQRTLYDHWSTFTQGRAPKAVYKPAAPPSAAGEE